MGYSFVSETDPCEEYICPMTDQIMLEPHQTDCCGNHLSASHAEKLTIENRPCPFCSVPSFKNSSTNVRLVFSTRLDRFFQRKILNMLVYCPHRKQGCEWEGPIKDHKAHVQSCDLLPWECEHCGFKSSKVVGRNEHTQSCPKRPVQCACDSKTPILSCDLEEHLKTCPAQVVPCRFADVGCQVKSLRKDMDDHMKGGVAHHQLLVSERNLRVTLEIKSKMDSQEETDKSKHEVAKLQGVLEEKEKQILALKNQLEATKKTDRKNSVTQDTPREPHPSNADRERQVGRLTEQLRERDEAIQRLRLRNESAVLGEAAYESLQQLAVDLRPKTTLSAKETKSLKAKLDEIVDKVSETQSQVSLEGSSDPNSPIGFLPDVPFCRGEFQRVVMTGLKKPWGVAVRGDKLYVVDNSGSYGVHIISLGDPSSSVETMVESASISEVTIPPAKCWYPRGVAVDANLNVILADTGCHRILKFSSTQKLLATANTKGVPGNTSGVFNVPIGVCVDSRNRVYVSDRTNHRVQILNHDLQFVKEFGQQGSSGLLEFVNPWDVAVDSLDNIYVADCGNRCVKVFSPALNHLRTIGRGGEKFKKGDLRAPSALCVDRNDVLYVADMGLKRVQVYDPDGKFRCSFGKFTDPHGIAVDEEGHVYVSDTGGGSLLNPLQACGRVQMFS